MLKNPKYTFYTIKSSLKLAYKSFFEDTKGVIRILKSKMDRQHNGQKTKENNDLQNTAQKTKDRATRA
jgi:hypothetical protein